MAFSWTATTFCGPSRCNLGSHAILWAPNLLLYGHPRSFVESHAICLDIHAKQLDAHKANVDIQSCVMVAHLYAMGDQLSRMGFHVCEWKSTRLCGRPKSGHTYIWISTSSVGCPRSSRRLGGNPRECPHDCMEVHEQPHDIGWKATHSYGRPPENLRELRVYGATWTPIPRCVAGHVGLYVYGHASVAHCVMGTHSLMRSPARSNGIFLRVWAYCVGCGRECYAKCERPHTGCTLCYGRPGDIVRVATRIYGRAYMPTQYVYAHITGQKNSPLPKGERSKARF